MQRLRLTCPRGLIVPPRANRPLVSRLRDGVRSWSAKRAGLMRVGACPAVISLAKVRPFDGCRNGVLPGLHFRVLRWSGPSALERSGWHISRGVAPVWYVPRRWRFGGISCRGNPANACRCGVRWQSEAPTPLWNGTRAGEPRLLPGTSLVPQVEPVRQNGGSALLRRAHSTTLSRRPFRSVLVTPDCALLPWILDSECQMV